jgi:hypothetical protein
MGRSCREKRRVLPALSLHSAHPRDGSRMVDKCSQSSSGLYAEGVICASNRVKRTTVQSLDLSLSRISSAGVLLTKGALCVLSMCHPV